MPREQVHLLLVEDNPGDARLVREALRDAHTFDAEGPAYELTVVDRVAGALDALERGNVDIVLLDLGLPDSEGYSTFERVRAHAAKVPIVVLTRRDDDSVGLRAMREGAQDYLAKSQFDAAALIRSLRYARERKGAEHDRLELARSEEAREHVAASEARLRALSDTVPQIVWRADAAGRNEYFNRRWYEYTGLSEEESFATGTTGAIHPDDYARGRERWELALDRGDPYEVELRLRRADGLYRWFIVRAEAMRDEQGKLLCWFGTSTDIDDHKRAERALRTLAYVGAAVLTPTDTALTLEQTARALVPTIADGCLLYTRDAESTRLAYSAHSDIERERSIRRRDDREAAWDDQHHGPGRVMATGISELLVDVADSTTCVSTLVTGPFRALLQELRAHSVVSVPLVALGRTLGAIVLVSNDPSRPYGREDLPLVEEVGRRVAMALESARLYELSERERKRAEQASRAKDEFLSVASHELRTPLNAILGWARMLRSGGLPEAKVARALETIERNAKVQVQLIEDILDVNRIMTGKLRLDLAQVEIGQVVDAAIDVVQPAADAKNVRIRSTIDPAAVAIHADGARLQQVIWNLLSNAVKFTSKGGSVQIALHREQEHVELTVSDDGQGIESTFLPHVFEPFRQADGSSTRSHGGLGLGLAIVKHLVELHGGSIVAHSGGVGRGSTFSVELPIHQKRMSEVPEPPVDTAFGGNSQSRLPWPSIDGVRVLVVEDQPDTRELLRSVLESCGALPTVVGSVKEAHAAFRSAPPEVLVSDIAMPDEDGFALLRWVRGLPADEGGRTPAIALTAYAREEDRTRALEAGFVMHLKKPVEPRELVVALAEAVRKRAPMPGQPLPRFD